MTSRFNELLHGDLDTVEYHLDIGTLNASELGAVLTNVIRQLRATQREVQRLQETKNA